MGDWVGNPPSLPISQSLYGPGVRMAKSKDVRPVITFACTDCKERNYTSQKNRRNDPNRLELKKFCPRCRKHTAHREAK